MSPSSRSVLLCAAVALGLLSARVSSAQAPSISVQPSSTNVGLGTTLSLWVTATSATNFFHQWTKGGTNLVNGGTVSGATASNLVITSVTSTDAASYRVVVTNIFGSVTSSVATVTVGSPPGITSQPVSSQTVTNGWPTSITMTATGTATLTYRWFKNGVAMTNGGAISGTTAATLSFSPVSTNDTGNYSVLVTNLYGSASSATSALSAVLDLVPPVAFRAYNTTPTNVQVIFSEPMELTSVANTINYAFTNAGIAISGAAVNANTTIVTLTTSPLTSGSNYWLRISGVRDAAVPANTNVTTSLRFMALPYAPQDIGNPGGTTTAITVTSNGVDIAATGGGAGGTSDQFGFGWQVRAGDFDVRLRVAGLSLADTWTKAGLMARETMDTGSKFFAMFATPAMNGDFAEWRSTINAASTMSGSFPANYPNTWLRLKRVTTNFTGYASFDGAGWVQVGTVGLSLSNQLYVGLATSAKSTNTFATSQFRDIADMTGTVVIVSNTFPRDAMGPTSRKTPIAISEVMYKPAPRADSNNVEFVELYNSNPWFHNIGGYQLIAGSMSYTFPSGTVIAGGAYLCVAASPQGIANVYGVTNAMGPYTGSLKRSDTIKLIDEVGSELLIMSYDNKRPWPKGADGTGCSLILENPTYGENDPRSWDISSQTGGTPGAMNTYVPDALDGVVINEFLAHTDLPLHDYIELYNHDNSPKDLSGAWLSNDAQTNKFQIPNGTTIPARGFVYFIDTQLGFRLDKTGDQIFLINSNLTHVIDAINFEAQENPVSMGRVPDGSSDFYRLASLTAGTNNGPQRASSIVINELMFDPISKNDDDQYIELFNRDTNSVDISGWQFSSGVNFTFPSNTVMSAGSYLVVARNAARLRTNYVNLNFANCLGNFGGKLSHGGERVALAFPHTSIVITNGLTNSTTMYVPVSEVTYGTGGTWGMWAAGGGSSLELTDPNADTRLAANWADSDETSKSVWTNVEITGVLDHGSNYNASWTWVNSAQLGILDVGECLVDDVEIYAAGNPTNLVANPGFETGLTNWYMEGAHVRSSLENSGYNGSTRSLHIRTSSRIWSGANSCEFLLLTNQLVGGQTATMRYKARWQHGWPEVYLRLNGNWLEATGTMPVPANLGSPGLPNSRYLTNAPPAIYAVTHTPTVPAASQQVVVTAKVNDPDGVTNVVLNYRVDPATAYTSVSMKDDGTGGDTIANDGIFSGTIPGQTANKIVAFTVTAADTLNATNRFPALRDINEPARECVVLFGDGNPSGSFSTYHLWMTANTVARWNSLADLSNESMDCTMVNGNRVIYNMVARYAGSPYHQTFTGPYGALCHYKWTFNDDDRFLGATSFNKIHQPGNGAGDDNSMQREQTAHTLMRALGVPWLNRRYMAVYVNGNRRGMLMEDAQTPDSDVVDERWPNDANGWLYKMQPWFEFPINFSDSAGAQNYSWCRLDNFTTSGGTKKTARYRWNYMVRSTPYSANDYTNVFTLIDAANVAGNDGLTTSMKNIADMENWMRVFAANHTAGNWDSFGAQNSQNLYGYIGQTTKYSLLMWDYNIVFDHTTWLPGQNLFTVGGAGANMTRIFQVPEFLRMYWRALLELANGPLDFSQYSPLVDAKYASFLANGQAAENPATMKTWMTAAQTSLLAQASAVNATNFTVSPSVSYSNNIAYFSGSAPFNVKTILVNGSEWPVTWTSITGWTARVVVPAGTNVFSISGLDIHGQPIAGSTGLVSAIYNTPIPSPVGKVVFTEIMHSPTNGPQYVELVNNSTNTTFDLSGWEINGLGYTFPPGSFIGPKAILTLSANTRSYLASYGITNIPFGEFTGALQTDGETLSLLIPGVGQTTVVSRVKYQASSPWPESATNGVSLQVLDPTNDISRVSNWGASVPSTTAWTYVAVTGVIFRATNFVMYLNGAGDLYVDDVRLITNVVQGASVISNGDFETGDLSGWVPAPGFSGSSVSTNFKHSGSYSLHIVSTGAGSSTNGVFHLPFEYINNVIVTQSVISFWYLQSTNSPTFTAQSVQYSGLSFITTVNPSPPPQATPQTPNTTNSMYRSMPAYPPLWINEVSPSNTSVIADNNGQREPWLEIYNAGTTTVSLAGLWLSDNYTNLLQWAFPTNTTIGSNKCLIVWCDAQTNQTATNALHTNFRLPPGSGRVALSRVAGSPQIVDYLTYTNVPVNWSYGDIPDGQPFYRTLMFTATPGATNNGAVPAATVRINEWMAANLTTITNPVGGTYDDWIELYNYGDAPVNLGGFYLTDTLATPDKWKFPTNTIIAAGQFLIVWADNQNAANATGPGIHSSFALSKTGEEIGFYSPSLVAIDTLAFGPQTNDITEGRWPDAAAGIYTLAIPTPGAPNIVSTNNTPASFTNSPAWYADEMTSLVIDSSAIDTDSPPQTLSYAMTGAPAGSTIDTNSGLFSWSPTESDGPSTNTFIVTATDNGWPQRTATQNVALVIGEVNRVPQPGISPSIATYAGSPSFLALPATDPDLPANTLTYSLGTNAPAGATINSANGLVAWTPSDADAGTTVPVSVIVTDNGLPPLSATGTIYFSVASLGTYLTAGLIPPSLLQINATSGSTYRIESADDLSASLWWFLTNQAATGDGTLSIDLSGDATNAIRFYRVLRSP